MPVGNTKTHRRRQELISLDVCNNLVINNQFRINLPIPLHPQYPLLAWEINEFGTYLEFPWISASILFDVEVGDLPVIFDFTHPTSLPLSDEPGLGRVMVVARVQTVVPLCKISVPDGSVKATCQSLSSNMLRWWVTVYKIKMEERALT